MTDPLPWTIEAEAPEQVVSEPTRRLAMDLDPRKRTVRLHLAIVTGGSLDVRSGAVARSFIDAPRASWGPAVAWLRGPEARVLLDTIAAGYTCELRWTGDADVTWSDDAWQAGAAVLARVIALACPDGSGPAGA